MFNLFKKTHLLNPRTLPWEMKPLSSAETKSEIISDGRLKLSIKHELLKNVTPEMICWWFKNIEGEIIINGKSFIRYHIWHPIDHISVNYVKRCSNGSIGPGTKIHITEALGGNLRFLTDVITTVEKLDTTGFRHVHKKFGITLAEMDYKFTQVESGTSYENNLTVGLKIPIIRYFFNRFLRPLFYTNTQGQAWLKHNVEEVGNFQYFLPELYRSNQ